MPHHHSHHNGKRIQTAPTPRLSRARRRALRQRRALLRYTKIGSVLAVLALIMSGFFLFTDRQDPPTPTPSEQDQEILKIDDIPVPPPMTEEPEPDYALVRSNATRQVDESFPSEYVILADLKTGAVLAEKNSQVIINPASMTKILTLLVAVENITNLDGTFTMTWDITDYCFVNECSVVGYEVDEVIPVKELFYGCILNSGADACLALAELAAGSHEAFVERMNEKLEELGLSETSHFTNCVGLYDEEHYCTAEDMALILKAALENEKCREVLSTKTYATAATNHHPSGQNLSNWFIRRIEEQNTGEIAVLCGKTGYVSQSGYCAASYGESEGGQGYLCVTGNSYSTWQSIYDHAELYKTYCS